MNVTGAISDEIKAAAEFFAEKLMDGRLHRHIHVEVILDTGFAYAGLCSPDEDRYKPKFFTVSINPTAHENVIQCLAHELVHVMQWASGKMEELASGRMRYKGVEYAFYGNNDIEAYEDYPWEDEAYKLEEVLFDAWLDTNRNWEVI